MNKQAPCKTELVLKKNGIIWTELVRWWLRKTADANAGLTVQTNSSHSTQLLFSSMVKVGASVLPLRTTGWDSVQHICSEVNDVWTLQHHLSFHLASRSLTAGLFQREVAFFLWKPDFFKGEVASKKESSIYTHRLSVKQDFQKRKTGIIWTELVTSKRVVLFQEVLLRKTADYQEECFLRMINYKLCFKARTT